MPHLRPALDLVFVSMACLRCGVRLVWVGVGFGFDLVGSYVDDWTVWL